MTIELDYLAACLALALVQILLADFARTRQYGLAWNTGARDEPMPPLKPSADRLLRAQANLFETLPLFAAGILIIHVVHKDGAGSALGAGLYFWARAIYVPLYAFGVRHIRSLVWIVSLLGLIMVLAAPFIG